MSKEKKEKTKDKEKEKLNKFDARGVQTLFRTVSRNHYNLIRMVDAKASIILTINSIIITLLMGVMYMAPPEQMHALQLGSKILLNCGMASMVFALLAMLPHRYYNLGKNKLGYKGSLYAASYSKLSLEDYHKEMKRVMKSGHSVYDEMIDDFYYLGKSVSKKQLLIVISVIFFLTGLVVTIIHSLSHGIMIEKIFFN